MQFRTSFFLPEMPFDLIHAFALKPSALTPEDNGPETDEDRQDDTNIFNSK